MGNNSYKINVTAEKYIKQIEDICKKKKPLVAIHCMTYNHESYLREALEGFLMQQTEFPFVAIVHDDASTDGTIKILEEYAEKFPDIILPIFEKENQYSKSNGELSAIMNLAIEVTGAKYIAMCEGDDYWTYPLKLQKQVNFLEANDNIIYTCHRFDVQVKKERKKILAKNSFLDKFKEAEGFEFDINYNFKGEWITKTLTAVYRAECLSFNELKNCKYYRDTHLVYQILSHGNGYCFQFNGGTYRKQETGIWSQTNTLDQLEIEIEKWKEIASVTSGEISKWKIKRCRVLYIREILKNRNYSKLLNFEMIMNLLKFPIEYYKNRKDWGKETEIIRIKSIGLNV